VQGQAVGRLELSGPVISVSGAPVHIREPHGLAKPLEQFVMHGAAKAEARTEK